MKIEKAVLNLLKEVKASTRGSHKNLLHTRPIGCEGLKLAEPLSIDIVNITETSLLKSVFGEQTVEKGIYDVTKWQREFFARNYDTLKKTEERASYISKLRLAFGKIQSRKYDEFSDFTNNEDIINFIRENFQYLHHKSQSRIVELLKNNRLPDENFDFNFDNNKMFELVLKDKKYNLDYVKELMKKRSIAGDIDECVLEYSRKIDENIAELGIKFPKAKICEIPQQLKECEINRDLYHSLPFYHGVRGGDEAYKMELFKKHGSSRIGTSNGVQNVLYTTEDLRYAEHYGGPNVLKMYFRKDYPIVDVNIMNGLHGTDSWKLERLIYDLLYEKGIKFIKNGREILVIDPKAVTFVSDFKNNYIP